MNATPMKLTADEQAVIRTLIERERRRRRSAPLRDGDRRAETFRLPIKLAEAFEERVQRLRLSKSEAIQQAMEDWIERG